MERESSSENSFNGTENSYNGTIDLNLMPDDDDPWLIPDNVAQENAPDDQGDDTSMGSTDDDDVVIIDASEFYGVYNVDDEAEAEAEDEDEDEDEEDEEEEEEMEEENDEEEDEDIHEDMRLDIDDMSYEELLVLEEHIGNVQTGLNIEAILNCTSRCRWQSLPIGPKVDGPQCSICLDNYVDGANIGKLACGHHFHFKCIKKWLMEKNSCPICKKTAVPN